MSYKAALQKYPGSVERKKKRSERRRIDKTIKDVIAINEEDNEDDEDQDDEDEDENGDDEEQDFETYSKNLDTKAIAAARFEQL
jgi:hypothetical protein